MSLRNPLQKMSKSDNQDLTRINLDDTPDMIHNKIRKSLTDFTSQVTFDPINRPGVANLITIYSALTRMTTDEIEQEFVGKETVTFKDRLSEVIIEHLKPIQSKMVEYETDDTYIASVLAAGAERARERAVVTLREVEEVLGID